jgi:hypothetical protein
MKITYKHYCKWKALADFLARVLETITNWMWNRAHYQNGKGAHLGVPKDSLRECWNNSHPDNQP